MEKSLIKIRNLRNSLFEEYLSYIFTDWQINIIKKRINNEPLNKTEKEEFSRKIKKKIIAIQVLKDLNLILF